MKGKFSLAVVLCLFLVGAVRAESSLKVIEADVRAFSTVDGLQIDLAVENDFRSGKSAKLLLEILDKNDRVLVQNETVQKVGRGRSTLQARFRFVENDVETLLWQRLRYTVEDDGGAVKGVVSLSEIMPELFELRVNAADEIYAGMTYLVRVRAFHPAKETPVADVEIAAELEIDVEVPETDEDAEDERIIKSSGKTDAEGFVILEFQIPADLKFSDEDSGQIKLVGTKNGLQGKTYEWLDSEENDLSVYFTTDKPLYQPDQKIYARLLALRQNKLDSGNTIVAGKEFEISIKDEDGTLLFREKVTTSRFGIASIQWQIPANAKLGTYRIEADAEDVDFARDMTHFKVSRYDLPNFIVKTKPDKDFYLPGQREAEVTVDALYLFGEPVAAGRVKVVRESGREWNYKEQKWEITEEAVYEGATGADGKYTAKIDLGKAHEELQKEKYDKFDDLNFTAYFTDSTTNKTEQRRFDLRVTKEPIHVYMVKETGEDHNPRLPLTVYVTTYSADGKPVSCGVEVTGKYEDEKTERPLATAKTGSNGVGKAEFFAPTRADEKYKTNDLDIKIIARDAQNLTGTSEFGFDIDEDEKSLRVRTDKTIYRKGEPVKIEILSSEREETVFVDVLKNHSSIESRRVKLKDGRAELKIPYDPNFKSFLTVTAFFDDEGDAVEDARRIVFPTPRNLRVDAASEKETFRPGEEAALDFNVVTADKKQTEAALGVIVLDRAVEERAATDANFGGGVDIFQNFGGLDAGSWDEIDVKEITAEMQLGAEAGFAGFEYETKIFDGDYSKSLSSVFAEKLKAQFDPVRIALQKRFEKDFAHAADDARLRKILSESSIDFDSLRDPWETPYRAAFSVYNESNIVTINSAGANKTFGDGDDFTAVDMRFNYFTETGLKISEAVKNYTEKTGKFVRDEETLRAALLEKDIVLEYLADRWGEPYRVEFGVSGRTYTIAFRSSGEDKKFGESYYDSFVIWTSHTDYFARDERKIAEVLDKFVADKKTFPTNETEFKRILRDGGVDFETLRDGWGRPFYLQYENRKQFADKVVIENVARQGDAPRETLSLTPVTRELGILNVRSLGEDGTTADNWRNPWIGSFVGIISEQTREDTKPKLVVPKTIFANGKSAIYGVVTDPNKAVVPNADVTITNTETRATLSTKTNVEGVYLQTNLPAGKYSVRVNSPGFKTSVVNEIQIGAEKIAEINFTLEVGGLAETVTVTAGGEVTIDASSTKLDTNVFVENFWRRELPVNGRQFSSLLSIAPGLIAPMSGSFQIDGASGSENVFVIDGQEVTNIRSGALGKKFELVGEERKNTPRLREYFPETLLWIPELTTNPDGKVTIRFRMADNITTWKIYAIASDVNGRLGFTSKEIKAFQPFFVDLDPPKFLTDGDEIFLPVQVRNYTESKQNVSVEMARADWFDFLGAGKHTIETAPRETGIATFGFKTIAPVKDGRQRVTAIAEKDSDAIEKPVTVRPNGQEIVGAESKLFQSSAEFDINFPANALAKTRKAELKIYPNLMAHVTESIEGLLQRPYGCGEQTISSTYPNLMILKFASDGNTALEQQARRYLQKGYERLLGYQTSDGGFSYWGGTSESDVALTAYALRFLNDAKGFVAVDEKVIENARAYLIKQQRADGSFVKKYYDETSENARRTKIFTAYVARTLAMTKTDKAVLDKALAFLKTRNAEIDEPYALALFGLASLDAGNLEDAQETARRLEKIAIAEGDKVYWNLETNTPFYGWGTAGRIETTALVLQLLKKTDAQSDLIARATMFLLRNKDRYGVWHSTQTTINVLDAFLASLSASRDQTISVSLNGEKLKDFAVSSDEIAPVVLDLTEKLSSANRLEISSSTDSTLMSQIVATHYIDWKDSEISSRDVNQSRQLRFEYRCDKNAAKIMEEITCAVEAERIGFKGYGMLLAEIGLPPGADVSRESLEKALEADRSLSRYDILPDRVILYMWSKAGGTKFNFKFKPRYAINAQTPSSVLYDYYNEEAKAMLAPMRFEVR